MTGVLSVINSAPAAADRPRYAGIGHRAQLKALETFNGISFCQPCNLFWAQVGFKSTYAINCTWGTGKTVQKKVTQIVTYSSLGP